MNIVLFTDAELTHGIASDDHRVAHVRNVLAIPDGRLFDAGVVNGVRGKAKFGNETDGRLRVEFETTQPASELYPVDVVVGISRPQTCRFVLRALTSLGVRSIEFVLTETGEQSYASSRLWSSGEYLKIVSAAVSQAFETTLPEVRFHRTLAEVLTSCNEQSWAGGSKFCLDNYEATTSLASTVSNDGAPSCLLIGSERGWSDGERDFIREQGFLMASVGQRVLRVETAAIAAVSTLLAKKFWASELGTLSTR